MARPAAWTNVGVDAAPTGGPAGMTDRSTLIRRVLSVSSGLILLGIILYLRGGRAAEPIPTVREIAPGVFSRQLQYRSANQTFVVFDDYVVVFDPGEVVEVRGLMDAIRARTDRPVRYVVSSHFHPDHAAGASVFEMEGAGISAGAGGRFSYEGWARNLFLRRVEEEETGFSPLQYPRFTFIDQPLILDDGNQRMEIRHYGHGHTTGDLIAWLPKHGVLLVSDVSNNGPLNLANANIASWIDVLRQLLELPVQTVVPGHGERGGRELLEMNSRFLTEMLALVGDMVTRGMSYEDVLAEIEIPFHEQWTGVEVRANSTNVLMAFRAVGGRLDKEN